MTTTSNNPNCHPHSTAPPALEIPTLDWLLTAPSSHYRPLTICSSARRGTLGLGDQGLRGRRDFSAPADVLGGYPRCALPIVLPSAQWIGAILLTAPTQFRPLPRFRPDCWADLQPRRTCLTITCALAPEMLNDERSARRGFGRVLRPRAARLQFSVWICALSAQSTREPAWPTCSAAGRSCAAYLLHLDHAADPGRRPYWMSDSHRAQQQGRSWSWL